ncbi:protoporphyrinogen/coproporphyrinogen oxidase [Nocardioides bigeumensis]|uniref:Protoporphyrinogen oxidase n=1 Tax=Nocardioides bigeumensis TaxID=433657 RepID=A0ABN2YME4_9ACTN
MRVVVVGGGVAGLTAAYVLGADHDVLLLEASPEVGGKLRGGEVAGVRVDVGAEAMLARRPEGVDLARDLGLPLVHPATTSSRVWSRGSLRPLPRSLLGVPIDVDDLAASGVLSSQGLARVREEPSLPPTPVETDLSVGDLVAARLGDEVVERLVEPLLGGVYAGRARALSLRAAAPQVAALAARGSLLEAAARLPVLDSPVFAGIEGGMHRLAAALAGSGLFEVRLSATVRELTGAPGSFALTVGETRAPQRVEAQAVVLATPAAPTARLLGSISPTAAALLAQVESASMAIVTLALRAADVPLDGASSGFLVPPVEGRDIKAATYSFAKWDWVRAAGAPDVVLLRTSLGRAGEQAALQVPDEVLVERSLADLAALAGVTARPVDAQVQRWGGALPQYAVGHLDLVSRVRSAVAAVPGLAVCGAAYDGVGIPAVIASARAAAAQVVAAQWLL